MDKDKWDILMVIVILEASGMIKDLDKDNLLLRREVGSLENLKKILFMDREKSFIKMVVGILENGRLIKSMAWDNLFKQKPKWYRFIKWENCWRNILINLFYDSNYFYFYYNFSHYSFISDYDFSLFIFMFFSTYFS